MNEKLGKTYSDRITGFEGVATGICEYLSGCNQVLLAPRVSADGGFMEAHWFDEQRLQALGAPKIELDNGATPGFDKAAPRR